MTCGIFRPSGKLFVSILLVLGIACVSVQAFAQQQPNVVAGCNKDVWSALTAKAEAQVAYDAAVTRQMINKPFSVLDISCFNQAAGVSAVQGGAIFSGPFTGQLQSSILPNIGDGTYNCNGPLSIGALWNQIANAGISMNAPYATFDDLLTGTLPTPNAGQDFTTGWNAASQAQIFQTLKTNVAQIPPTQPPPPLDFSQAKSSCDVLKTAGIVQNCPPPGGTQGGP
jgi:hypothetical protein